MTKKFHHTQGDEMEIVVRDSLFGKIYKNKVNVSVKKEVRELLNDLKNKGVVDLVLESDVKEKKIKETDWFG